MLLDEFRKEFSEYKVKIINIDNIIDTYNLLKNNEYYISKVQNHKITLEECIKEITFLPPNKTIDSKTYVNIYQDKKCICVVDFIESYPKENIAFLGLFILDVNFQGRGLGTKLFEKVMSISRKQKFEEIRLGCMEGNQIGYSFWRNMGFIKIYQVKQVIDNKEFLVNVMSKKIKDVSN